MGKFLLVTRLAGRDLRRHKAQAVLLLPWAWPCPA